MKNIKLPEAPKKCGTCDGRGEIGGFVNAESGHQTDPCPDCAPKETKS